MEQDLHLFKSKIHGLKEDFGDTSLVGTTLESKGIEFDVWVRGNMDKINYFNTANKEYIIKMKKEQTKFEKKFVEESKRLKGQGLVNKFLDWGFKRQAKVGATQTDQLNEIIGLLREQIDYHQKKVTEIAVRNKELSTISNELNSLFKYDTKKVKNIVEKFKECDYNKGRMDSSAKNM